MDAKESVPLVLTSLVVFIVALYSFKKKPQHITYNHLDVLINLACAIQIQRWTTRYRYGRRVEGSISLVGRAGLRRSSCGAYRAPWAFLVS